MTLLPGLAAQLRTSVQDAASSIETQREGNADFERLILLALEDYSRRRPLPRFGELSLQAGRVVYDCPDDLLLVQALDWGREAKARLQAWDDAWPGRLPDMRVADDAGRRVLYLMPPATARQIQLLGSAASYRYGARHRLSAETSTLMPGDEPLVLLRAQAEAMRELAISHTVKPFQLRDGISATPRNGTPAYLHTVLLEEFERRVCQ